MEVFGIDCVIVLNIRHLFWTGSEGINVLGLGTATVGVLWEVGEEDERSVDRLMCMSSVR